MTKQYLVIGAGRFGSSVATTLYELGHNVMVVDIDPSLVQEISESVTHAVQADATSEAALSSLGIKDFDVIVVAIGHEIQSSIMTCILLIEMGARFVVARAQTELHGKVLSKIGVNRVVFPERDMGQKLAHSLSAFNIVDLIELSSNSNVVEVSAPEEMVGRSLKELNLRARFGINVIALRSIDGKTNISPGAEDRIKKGDLIVAVGDNKALKKMGWI
ncbi:MAG TPA: TrkA family potassium uptake protein [Bacillota bacterium]|nr:TrkA family potassium uptake protein [Bacillota bacterium]HOJ83529.1 TrkA family potassium uptake protein [Bacillota bacterium]HOL15237.1 TrkA family potassium uptake protein [Bacillota bacterium]HPZ11876.1 TrkA family potassium uptake protein [Bacillota bacterium]HQE10147.1 TrkA family potassium uptake protein [Bacillota bacterium]